MKDCEKPFIPADQTIPEITVKAVILSIILTIVLGAANAYLGLKVGLTISASIPAAIISMAVLRMFRNYNVLENNIVQTAASSGEALSSGIAFTLPSLLILQCWTHFDYIQTTVIAMAGGVLGVCFAVPLRRVLLADKSLKFPEGTAIGKVLQASASKETGVKDLVIGSLVGSIISIAQIGLKIIASSVQKWSAIGGTVVGYGLGFSPALVAAGYIVGIELAISSFIGVIIGWGIGIPLIAHMQHITSVADPDSLMGTLWSHQVRYLGVGAFLVGGLWTVISLFKPMLAGVKASFASMSQIKLSGKESIPRTERDIPMQYVIWCILLSAIPLFILILSFSSSELAHLPRWIHFELGIGGIIFVLLIGFLGASICGYFAGLVGTSASPISGISLLSVIIASLLLSQVLGSHLGIDSHSMSRVGAAAVAIIFSAIVIAISAICNDTIQDLKAGQMVGATPWKQQVMLMVGVGIGALVIPLILELLFNAYGLAGVFPHPGMDPTQALSAPQANLIAAVVEGVFSHQLPWGNILTGGAIAVVCLIIDGFLKEKNMRLHVLGVGLGIYLPLEASTPLIVGGFLAYFVNHKLDQYGKYNNDPKIQEHIHHQRQRGLLLACGLVAGSALMGVVLAIPFVISGSSSVFQVVPDSFVPYAEILGLITLFGLCYWIYKIVCKQKQN